MTPGTDPDHQIKLLVCDDHRILTDALTLVITRDPALELVAPPVSTPEEGIALVAEHKPDVVLMDVRFQGPMDGVTATREVKRVSPSTKVIIMTAFDDERLLVDAVEAGASGFLTKTEAVEEVLGAVKAAAEGEVLIDPTTLTRVLQQVAVEREARRDADAKLSQLTEREREILQLLAQGMRNEEIAKHLYISPQTVQTHIRNVLGKLDVHSKLEAVTFAARYGAVSV